MTRSSSTELVTLVVKHRIKKGLERPYEVWLHHIVGVASAFPGHLGVDVVIGKNQGLPTYTSVLRFDSTVAMQRWLGSTERHNLVGDATYMLADGDLTEVVPIKEFWFSTLDEQANPPRWKQAVVTMTVILPLTLLVPLAWGPVFSMFAWLSGYLISTFLITLTIVVFVVYWMMPFATRLFSDWLSPDPQNYSRES